MTFWQFLPWIYVLSYVSSMSLHDRRSHNDISLDFNKLESLGHTDSLIRDLKAIAQSSHDCGVREVPKLRRKFLSNSSITCNDGSPAGYYIRKSYGSKKWIVFLEGGWYCFNNVSCQLRWANSMKKYMSSKAWPKRKRVTGILSWNPEENPFYFHSNVIYVPYCSSDSWSGTAPIGTNGNEFAFMGSLIVEQLIKDLIPKGLKHASKLILTGSSAGGTGVLVNLDRVAAQMAELAPSVEVRGVADSGWFLDYPQYKNADCVEPLSCAPVDVTKWGIRLWQGRVPEACKAQYPESEHWRCYFGYKMYSTLKTPLYVIQYLFDEAQIHVDNVFNQLRSDSAASLVSKDQWDYLHKLGQEVRNTLENVSAVFAPACLSHEILTRTDWFNVTVNGVQLGQSIYCWENSHRYEKCVMNSNSQSNAIEVINERLQGDAPKTKSTKDRKRRRKDRERKRRKKNKKKKSDRKRRRRKKKNRNSQRSRSRRHQNSNCAHHLIDSCPLPQCNGSCPKYRNRFTGAEMDFFKLYIRYGLDRKEVAKILGKDLKFVESMDADTISNLILDFVRRT